MFTSSPTELTTAATDLILAIIAFGGAAILLRFRSRHPWKTGVWMGAFSLLGISAFLGALAHGLRMSEFSYSMIWQPLNLGLGLTVALFGVGVVFDLWGRRASVLSLPFMLGSCLAFFVATWFFPADDFGPFVFYEGVVMLFALGSYAWLRLRKELRGAGMMALGVLISMAAAAVQAMNTVRMEFIWEFDNNGIFHLIQIPGLLALLWGLGASMAEGEEVMKG
jgi:hypothetical protein